MRCESITLVRTLLDRDDEENPLMHECTVAGKCMNKYQEYKIARKDALNRRGICSTACHIWSSVIVEGVNKVVHHWISGKARVRRIVVDGTCRSILERHTL